MKIVIAGGTGHLGQYLADHWRWRGHEVVILTRRASSTSSQNSKTVRQVEWDGKNDGPWFSEIDGADVVLNLAGRTVNCRYTPENLRAMMDSRVESTNVVGRAIAAAGSPPRLWLQMSTATIYAHSYTNDNDEWSGVLGGSEPDVPGYWSWSVDIARAWEQAQKEASTPRTRCVALRTAMVMGRHPQSVFGVLARMARWGLGGAIAGGRQYVSWIHEKDFAASLDFIIAHEDLDGAINICAPHPLPQKEFMKSLRVALGQPIGLPATPLMAEVGAWVLRTDTELLLKSRRVVPARLLDAGFRFEFSHWSSACADLLNKQSPQFLSVEEKRRNTLDNEAEL